LRECKFKGLSAYFRRTGRTNVKIVAARYQKRKFSLTFILRTPQEKMLSGNKKILEHGVNGRK